MTKQEIAKQHMDKHEWEKAIPVLLSDISESPKDPWSVMFLGICYYELKNFDEALKYFKKAETLLPDNPTPLWLQADALYSIGEISLAGKFYRKALDTDPEDEMAIKNWKRWLKLKEAAEQGPPGDAEQQYTNS